MKAMMMGLVLLAAPAFADALKLGDKAPLAGTKMKNVDGTEVSITDIAGTKGALVIFSCNHCPFVKAWEGRIATLGNEYRDKGVGVIVINANDPVAYAEDSLEEMQARAKKLGFKFPYAVDATSDVARAFGASKTPECFLFDAGGQLVYHGAVDDSKQGDVKEPYLKNAIEALLAGKEVAVKETKFVGCGIKFRAKS